MRKTLQLSELDCAVCAGKVEAAVRRVEGVARADVNFVTSRLTLEADDAAFDEVLARVKLAVPKADRDCRVL